MAEHAGAAMRRRQRRLRQWLRHERLSVAMALAETNHHAAPRGQTKARAREGVEHVLYEGLRAQKPPLPGKRPGLPPEPEPRGGAVTVGHVAAPVPSLAVPLLASAAGEVVDRSHPPAPPHARHRDEEGLGGGGEAEEGAGRRSHGFAPRSTLGSLSLPPSMRPGTGPPLPPLGRGGRRKRGGGGSSQRLLFLVVGVTVIFSDKFQQFCEFFVFLWFRMVDIPVQQWWTGTHSVLLGPGAVLGQGRCARVAQREGYGQTVQKAVLVPHLQFLEGRRLFFVTAEANPHGPACSENHRDSAVAVGQVVDAPVVQVVPCPLSFRQVLMVQTLQKTVEVPQMQLFCGCGRSCEMQRQVPGVSGRCLRPVHRQDVQVLRRGDFAAFCGIFSHSVRLDVECPFFSTRRRRVLRCRRLGVAGTPGV